MFTFNTGQTVIYTSPTGEQYRLVIKRVHYGQSGGMYYLADEENDFIVVCRETDIKPMEHNNANQ